VKHIIITVIVALVMAAPGPARAHCDRLDGPVVTAARKALEKADVNLVLVLLGKISFGASGQQRHVQRNGLVTLDKGIPHDVARVSRGGAKFGGSMLALTCINLSSSQIV
jgi:hypothetical protein